MDIVQYFSVTKIISLCGFSRNIGRSDSTVEIKSSHKYFIDFVFSYAMTICEQYKIQCSKQLNTQNSTG